MLDNYEDSSRATGYWVLFASILAASMAFVASTSLNVALPAIQVELGARGADLIWIPNAYVMVQASLIVVSGAMGDHYGRKRICILGIALFALASVVCSAVTTTGLLIVGRLAQGVGSSMIVPNSLAIVSSHFGQRGQGWAIGLWSGFTVLMAGVAPFFAGVAADFGAWRLVFLIHIPLGCIAALLFWRFVPESYDKSKSKSSQRMSLLGALLVTVGLGGLTFGFIESSTFGFASPLIFIAILGGILALAVFLFGERTGKYAILPLWLFRSRNFSAANFITLVYHGVVQPVVLYLPLNLIQVQGYSATFTGLSTVPMILIATLGSALVGPLLDRRGPRVPIVLGLAVIAAGFFLFANIGVTSGESEYFSTFFLPIMLFGLGFSLTFAPLTMAAMASAPETNAGIASGVNHTVTRIGQVLVVGVLGGLAISWFGQLLMSDAYVQSLPAEAQAQLAAEAGNLAETGIPDWLTVAQQARIDEVIRESFAATFSIMMVIGGVACVVSAIVAIFTINDKEIKLRQGQDILDDSDTTPEEMRELKPDDLLDTPLRESP